MEMCAEGKFGPGPLQNQLRIAWVRFNKWAKVNKLGCTVPCFTPASVGRPGNTSRSYPELESAIKGHSLKCLLRWIAAACEESSRVSNNDDEADNNSMLRASCLYALTGLVHHLDSCGQWLGKPEGERARSLGDLFMRSYSMLASKAYARNDCKWKWRPKFHGLSHGIDMAANGENIGRYSTWMDEDFVGKIGRVCGKTHRATMPQRSIQRCLP